MNKVITISRQFGSGGHEIGKKLAEHFNIPFYDKDILSLVEQSSDYSKEYLAENEEQIPSIFSNTFFAANHASFYPQIPTDRVFFSISNVLKEIAAKGPCVIVGRCADYVLHDLNPINFFIYASTDSKINRKLELQKQNNETPLSYEEMKKQIHYVDKQRAKYYEFYTDRKWGLPKNYDLCLNTSNLSVDTSVHILANYIEAIQK